MRNDTHIGLIFEAVFGRDDPYTVAAKAATRDEHIGWHVSPDVPVLFDADKMLQQLLLEEDGALCLAARRDGRPIVIANVPEPAREVLKAWADGGFDGRAHYALRWMHGESVADICAALRSLKHFAAAGVSRNDVGDLSEAGYDLGLIGEMLDAGVTLEYALAAIEPTHFRAPPF